MVGEGWKTWMALGDVSAQSGWKTSSGPSDSSGSAADSWKPEGQKDSGCWGCFADWNSCCRPPFLEGIGSIPPNRRTIHEMENKNRFFSGRFPLVGKRKEALAKIIETGEQPVAGQQGQLTLPANQKRPS